MENTGFSYIADDSVIITSFTGFASVIGINVRINVIDKLSALYPNITVEIRKQSDDSLMGSYFTDNGIASFEIENGDYYAIITDSDMKVLFTILNDSFISDYIFHNLSYQIKFIPDDVYSNIIRM